MIIYRFSQYSIPASVDFEHFEKSKISGNFL